MSIRANIFVFFSMHMLIVMWNSEPVLSQDSVAGSNSQETGSQNSVIKSKVIYNAHDSIRFDVADQKVFLFGDAKVTYEDMDIKAGYIEFDMENNIVFAHGARDSLGKAIVDSLGYPVGDPVFKQGAEGFDAKQMTYNFKTKKGKINDIRTEEGEGVIHAKDAKKDTGDVYYVKNGKYSTCSLGNPHFYLKATKIKVIQDNKIIVGPSYLVVGDVPTPLMLPFGVFPNRKGRRSGVLIPYYGQSELGYFLKDGGYYFGLSDYFDLSLRTDIYAKGSFGVKANTNYTRRYKYNGFLGLNFSRIAISEKEFPDYSVTRDFKITWQHAQDPKANPSFQFRANVNAGSISYNKYNSYNPNEYLSNTLQSNVSMNKSWRTSNLSVSGSHSQNTITKTIDVTLPEIAFSRNRIYPFKRKNTTGKPTVFEKIGISATVNAKNQLNTTNSRLFKKSTDDTSKYTLELQPDAAKLLRHGIHATVPISTSMNLGPLIISPSAALNSVGYFQTIQKHYDTTKNTVIIDTVNKFKAAYDYNIALSASTKFYGMYLFKGGRLKAIRHVVTPNVTLSWRPDFSKQNFGFYETIQTASISPTNPEGTPKPYSYFEGGIYGAPPSGKSGVVSFSLSNNLEMKLRPSKKDTSGLDKKVMLIDNFSISQSYNIAAEHFNWSTINLSGRTRLFQKVDLTMSGIIDPYAIDDSTGLRIERFVFYQNGKIGRLTNASLSISTSLKSLFGKEPLKNTSSVIPRKAANYDELNYILLHPDYYIDFNVPWNLSFYYNIVYSKPMVRDTIIQSFTFNGDVSVTKKWKVGFRSGFDFVQKNFTFTSFDIYRDLHCWEMRLNWIPFGARKSYMLTIAVKASALQDLKLMRKRDWYDYN